MIHLPVESIVSKWYGESEKNMSLIFDACSQLDGAILFIDEVRIWIYYMISGILGYWTHYYCYVLD